MGICFHQLATKISNDRTTGILINRMESLRNHIHVALGQDTIVDLNTIAKMFAGVVDILGENIYYCILFLNNRLNCIASRIDLFHMSRFRITFLLPHAGLAGGIKVVATYAKILHDRGHAVSVLSIPKRNGTLVGQVKSIIKRRPIPARNPEHGPSHLDGLGLDWRILETCRPVTDADVPDADIVVATWWETAEWVSELSSSKGVKAYFLQHHEVHDGQPKERVAATWRLPLRKITISQWLSDTNQKVYGLGPIPIVHNSVDTDQFHAPDRRRKNPPVVGLLYSKTYWKGVKDSFYAIDKAREKFPDMRVLMFGATEDDEELPKPGNAELIVRPPQNQIKDIYGACDYWLCGSLAEGFHLPPLEAMACRLPVISTKVGGPMDIIRPGENGYLSPTQDPDALAQNLIKALSLSEEEWKAMSLAAYKTATDYTWDNATDLFLQELQAAIEKGHLDQPM